MKAIRWWMALSALLLLALGGTAEARKVALVIGNAAYANTTALTNPINDAKLVAGAARQAGFEVTETENVSIANFRNVLRDFRQTADGADVAMIYYAGHGMEGQGSNWLVPVDAKLESEFDLPYEAINLDRLFEAATGARVRMIVLDACRNNPFGTQWKRGVRAVPSGLAGMEIDDVLVIYAAAPGQVATDGTLGNSPFARSLAKRLPEAGLPVQLLGGVVRDDVLAATGGKQRPFVSASITGTPVYLVDRPQVAAAESGSGDRSRIEALMWQGASSSDSLSGYQSYLKEFPQGIFARMAQDRIALLQARPGVPTGVVRAPVAAPDPAPGARPGKPALVSVTPPPRPAAGPNSALVTPASPKPPISGNSGAGAIAGVAAAPVAASPQIVSVKTGTPPLTDLVPLPTIPATPLLPKQGYPDCFKSDEGIADLNSKVAAVNQCTVAIDQYYSTILTGYRRTMIEHQDRLTRLYNDQVAKSANFTQASQDRFYQAVMKEHADSNPDGGNFAEYRAAEARYNRDRAALQAKYCRYAGCAGSPPQAQTSPPPATTPPGKRPGRIRPGASIGF